MKALWSSSMACPGPALLRMCRISSPTAWSMMGSHVFILSTLQKAGRVVNFNQKLNFNQLLLNFLFNQLFLELQSEDDVQMPLRKDRVSVGRWYIEVFKSQRTEMELVLKHSGPNSGDSSSDGFLRLRGLPFGCTRRTSFSSSQGWKSCQTGSHCLWTLRARLQGKPLCRLLHRS